MLANGEINTKRNDSSNKKYDKKLVFFETMTGKNSNAASIESELFKILSELDMVIIASLKNGENIADKIREELAASYERYFTKEYAKA